MAAAQLPLAMAGAGEVVRVTGIRGNDDLRQHLAELGFVDGSEVKVISRAAGDVIVSVKGARLALNRSMAGHITVSI